MAGVKPLRKIKLGRETTAGTAVAATTTWRGLGTMQDDTPVEFTEEDIGILGGVDRTNSPFVHAQFDFDAVNATFEQITHVFEAGVKQVGTGAAEGSGYLYAYPLSTSAPATIKTYTLEGGDNQQAEESEYAFVKSFSLSGQSQQAVKIASSWAGRQVTPTTFTDDTAAPLPAVEDILFQKSKLYIDDVTGTIGSTQKSNTLLGLDLNCVTGWIEVFSADGNLYYSFHKMTVPELTLRMTFEHDGTAVAEKAKWRAQTPRQIRWQADGSALTTAGTDFSTKAVRVDAAGKWERFDKLGERNGNDIVTATFRARYNASAALFAVFSVCNNLATVP